jgi:hypothetical protein
MENIIPSYTEESQKLTLLGRKRKLQKEVKKENEFIYYEEKEKGKMQEILTIFDKEKLINPNVL